MDLAAAESKPLISVKDISFSYGSIQVLKDVTFPILPGDFLSIIGPNGSGKTTLIKIILGLLKPSRGEVRIMGKPVEEYSDWSKMGYVPQKATPRGIIFRNSPKATPAKAIWAKPWPIMESRLRMRKTPKSAHATAIKIPARSALWRNPYVKKASISNTNDELQVNGGERPDGVLRPAYL